MFLKLYQDMSQQTNWGKSIILRKFVCVVLFFHISNHKNFIWLALKDWHHITNTLHLPTSTNEQCKYNSIYLLNLIRNNNSDLCKLWYIASNVDYTLQYLISPLAQKRRAGDSLCDPPRSDREHGRGKVHREDDH